MGYLDIRRFSDFPAFFHEQTPTWSHFSTILKTHSRLALIPAALGQFGVWELSYILAGLLATAALGLFLRDRLPFDAGAVVDWALKTGGAIALYQLLHNWSERLLHIGLEFDYSFWALLFFALLWPCRDGGAAPGPCWPSS